jgi:hypothetical protein
MNWTEGRYENTRAEEKLPIRHEYIVIKVCMNFSSTIPFRTVISEENLRGVLRKFASTTKIPFGNDSERELVRNT